MFSWRRRHRRAPDAPSEPAVGATVMPGDHVAVRWQGDYLMSVIELVPRPFTPTVIVDGRGLHRRRRRYPAGRAAGRRALPRPGGRRRLGRLPGRQDRAVEPGRALRAGGRAVSGAGQPADLDRAARRARRRPASPRSAARPAWRGWPAIWWRRRRGSQISWPATESTRGVAAASTTSTAPPRSASNARRGRRSRAAAPSPPPTPRRAVPTCGGRHARTTPSPGCGSVPARRRRRRCC